MSDEEFEVILAEMKQLRQAIIDAVCEIVHQESEIQALHWLLQHKGIATAKELDNANEEGARQVDRLLQPETTSLDLPRHALPRRETPRLCHRGERRRVVPRRNPPHS